MNAPSGTFGATACNRVAVETANRGPEGNGAGRLHYPHEVPRAGHYDVAFFLDSRGSCTASAPSRRRIPGGGKPGKKLALEYLVDDRVVPAGDNVSVRFRLSDPPTGVGKEGLRDVTLVSFRTPGRDRRQTVARDAGDGIYEARLNLSVSGPTSST